MTDEGVALGVGVAGVDGGSSLGTVEGWAAAVLEADGDILVAGYTTNSSGDKDFAVARYNPDGTPDAAFGSGGVATLDVAGGDDVVRGVAVRPDGRILVAGDAANGSGTRVLAVARYNADGTLDGGTTGDSTPGDAFAAAGVATLAAGTGDAAGYGLVLRPDGKLVVAGSATFAATGVDMVAARFNADGSLDDGGVGDATPGDVFGTAGVANVDAGGGGTDRAYAIALAPDGKLILAGDTGSGSSFGMAAARLTADGALDPTFDADGVATPLAAGSAAFAAAVDGAGRVTLAGQALRPGGTDHDVAVVRLKADGTPDAGFGTDGVVQANYSGSSEDVAYAVALTPLGGAVAAGATGADFAVARLAPAGTGSFWRTYALRDANHNVTALVSGSGTSVGTVSNRFLYGPYGAQHAFPAYVGGTYTGNFGNPGGQWSYLHQGGRLEASTGLYSFRRRDYDPALGRWWEADPIGYPDGANRYLAWLSNPARYTDAIGLQSSYEDRNKEYQSKLSSLKYLLDNIAWLKTLEGMKACRAGNSEPVIQQYRELIAELGLPGGDSLADGFTTLPPNPPGGRPKPSSTSNVISQLNAALGGLFSSFFFDAETVVAMAAAMPAGDAYTEAFNMQHDMTSLYGSVFNRQDLAEAARHMMWSALLAYRYGSPRAKCVTDMHEAGQEGTEDSERDQGNNGSGRTLADSAPPGMAPGDDIEYLRGLVEQALLDGKGFTTNPNNFTEPRPLLPRKPTPPFIGPIRRD